MIPSIGSPRPAFDEQGVGSAIQWNTRGDWILRHIEAVCLAITLRTPTTVLGTALPRQEASTHEELRQFAKTLNCDDMLKSKDF